MLAGEINNIEELKKTLNAVLETISWQEQLVYQALSLLAAIGGGDAGRSPAPSGSGGSDERG